MGSHLLFFLIQLLLRKLAVSQSHPSSVRLGLSCSRQILPWLLPEGWSDWEATGPAPALTWLSALHKAPL